MSVSALADELRSPTADDPLVAVTFDDGFASVARNAAPLLAARGLGATVFCVAGHSAAERLAERPRGSFRLARSCPPSEIAELAAAGIEIGSHGFSHHPQRRRRASRWSWRCLARAPSWSASQAPRCAPTRIPTVPSRIRISVGSWSRRTTRHARRASRTCAEARRARAPARRRALRSPARAPAARRGRVARGLSRRAPTRLPRAARLSYGLRDDVRTVILAGGLGPWDIESHGPSRRGGGAARRLDCCGRH